MTPQLGADASGVPERSVRVMYQADDTVITNFFEHASTSKSVAVRNLIYLFAAEYGMDADITNVVRDHLLENIQPTDPKYASMRSMVQGSSGEEDSDMSTKSEKNSGTRSRVRKPADPISVAEPGSAELGSDTQSVTPPVTTGTEQQAPAKPAQQPVAPATKNPAKQPKQQPEVDFDDMDSIFAAATGIRR